jgi:hypothetical protein
MFLKVPVSLTPLQVHVHQPVFSQPLCHVCCLHEISWFLSGNKWHRLYPIQLQRKKWTIDNQNVLTKLLSCNCRWWLKVPIQQVICQELCRLITLLSWGTHVNNFYKTPNIVGGILQTHKLKTPLFLPSIFAFHCRHLLYFILSHSS